jgi:hypothetical protein
MQHMTSKREDLCDAEESLALDVEVAYGHIIHCTMTGKV